MREGWNMRRENRRNVPTLQCTESPSACSALEYTSKKIHFDKATKGPSIFNSLYLFIFKKYILIKI